MMNQINDREFPFIGAFMRMIPLELVPMQNGGWIVRQSSTERGLMGTDLGAYTTTREMLSALTSSLDSQEQEPQDA